MARFIGLYVEVEKDGKVVLRKVEEFSDPGFTNSSGANNNPAALPSDLNRTVKGHNAIGVLVSNPTCFICGGQMICI